MIHFAGVFANLVTKVTEDVARVRKWKLNGSLYVSGKLPTYPSPKPTSTLISHVGQNVGLSEGWVGSFTDTHNDPIKREIHQCLIIIITIDDYQRTFSSS